VANNDETQRAQRRSQRERQYEIDRITDQYVVEFRAGRSPRIEDYVQRYPQYTRELLEFALYFHTVGFDAPEPDEGPAAALSPASQKVLARIREQRPAAAPPPIEGLVKQGIAVGYTPRKLAEAVGLTPDLLAKLEARAIAVATIPPTLVRRLADTLKVAPEAVAAFFGAAQPGQAGAFYYADQPPAQQQESFLDAVQASALSPERKREWADIVSADAGKTG
jgi:Helix-turn-helix domain